MNKYITMRECLMRDIHDLEDQRDFAMSEVERRGRERDMARDMVHGLRKQRAIARKFGEQMERERDEAREAFAIATNNCVEARQRLREMQRELNKAREDAKRATYDAAQEAIKVSTVKSHWIEACRERGEAREALRKIQAADWKTAGELRGMARRALEAAK